MGNTQLNDKNQYKSVFKATALFGGVQIWQILISVVRSKLVALILGPTGMGISGLYTSSTELIKSFTNFGLNSSAVKFISEANSTGDKERLGRVVSVFMKLIWITGLLGMVAVIMFSPLLSKSAFGNYSYTVSFVLLSSTLLLQQLSSGHLTILQGTRCLKPLAKASILGSVIGLFTSIPLYYIWGTGGIVPALILGALTSLFLNWWFSHKLNIKTVQVTTKQAVKEGRGMMGMGIAMTLSGILSTAVAYVIRIVVSNKGGAADVGLYTAGMTIMTIYVGLVFTAMATDYFPRLSSLVNDREKSYGLVNQQAEIALLILGPILLIFLIIAPFAIIILYSEAFLPTTGFIQWACVGMLFKAISWAISFLYLAKGDTKTFIINETIANLVTFGTSIGGYVIWGLSGLGIAFMVSYILYFTLVFTVCRSKYGFSLSNSLVRIFVIEFLLLLVSLLIVLLVSSWIKYIPMTLFAVLCTLYSYYELNKRIDINIAIMNLFNKHKK